MLLDFGIGVYVNQDLVILMPLNFECGTLNQESLLRCSPHVFVHVMLFKDLVSHFVFKACLAGRCSQTHCGHGLSSPHVFFAYIVTGCVSDGRIVII